MSPATTTFNSSSSSSSSSSRWCPTPEQLMILEEIYRNGLKTPNASQIQQITSHLSLYGKIEGKNVFYWFQNHKARDRQKLRRKLYKQLQLQQQQQQLLLQSPPPPPPPPPMHTHQQQQQQQPMMMQMQHPQILFHYQQHQLSKRHRFNDQKQLHFRYLLQPPPQPQYSSFSLHHHQQLLPDYFHDVREVEGVREWKMEMCKTTTYNENESEEMTCRKWPLKTLELFPITASATYVLQKEEEEEEENGGSVTLKLGGRLQPWHS